MPQRSTLTFLHALAGLTATLNGQPTSTTGDTKTLPRTAAEALCGPEIVLLGDAWEHVQLERDALRQLAKEGDLVIVPQKTAALRSHLVFMQNRSVMIFGEARKALDASIAEAQAIFPRVNALALTEKREELLSQLPALEKLLLKVGEQYPEEALVSSSAASFLLPPVVPTLLIDLQATPPRAGEESVVRFRLKNGSGKPVTPDDLHTTHTEKLHALLLDPQFRDYHHEHPQPTGTPGEYEFRFTPKHDGPYRLWLDAMPVATGRGEFPISELGKIPRPFKKTAIPTEQVLATTVDGYRCELALQNGELLFGRPGMVTLAITDASGKPVDTLQPVMGAFAHMVGFADDFQTILHIHPTGGMPLPGQLGGPRINFQLRPSQPGWLRLYVQFSVEGKEHLAEFVVKVTVP
jgi:hypothetical protein